MCVCVWCERDRDSNVHVKYTEAAWLETSENYYENVYGVIYLIRILSEAPKFVCSDV